MEDANRPRMTEMPSPFGDLEKMPVNKLLHVINAEDANVHLAVRKAIPQIGALVKQIVTRMKKGGRIIYLGAGTSGRLGVLDASEIPPTFGMPEHMVVGLIAGGDAALKRSAENAEDDPGKAWQELQQLHVTNLDTVIGIAASGSTPYVIGGLAKAREHGLLTGCVTCNPDSEAASAAQYPIEVITGPEVVTGSTRMKAGTAQKMVLNMITTTVMIRLGRVKGNKMVYLKPVNKKLLARGVQMLVDELGISHDKAKELLMAYGSVQRAVDAFRQ
ncbi:MAG: N-acetylmuramic acid 6-phosphate etherase [Breznakibacter sp.]